MKRRPDPGCAVLRNAYRSQAIRANDVTRPTLRPTKTEPKQAMSALHLPSLQRWLQDHCESSDRVAGGLVIAAGGVAGQAQTVAEWPASGGMTQPLNAVAHAAVQRARRVMVAPTVMPADARHNRVISLPLRSGDAHPRRGGVGSAGRRRRKRGGPVRGPRARQCRPGRQLFGCARGGVRRRCGARAGTAGHLAAPRHVHRRCARVRE